MVVVAVPRLSYRVPVICVAEIPRLVVCAVADIFVDEAGALDTSVVRVGGPLVDGYGS